MKLVRRALAFPLYLTAFALHLLCAAFTVLSQKISGDEAELSNRMDALALTVFCCTAASMVPAYVLSHTAPVEASVLVAQAPMPSWRSVPKGFHPDQIGWVEQLIRINACIFAERAVRHELEPALVEFAACGSDGNGVTLDADYYEVTVNGVAKVNGSYRPFNVALNHYPPATGEWGFIATDIKIERGEAQVSCAAPITN